MRATAASFAAMASSSVAAKSLDLRLMTYNIRVDADKLEDGETAWDDRYPSMVTQINDQIDEAENMLMCTQEGYRYQLQDLQADLNGPWWDFLGWGRDGGRDGEYASIIYQSSKWENEEEETYWLTEGLKDGENREGEKGWDASFPRTMNVARLKHKETGVALVYICTHFDYEGEEAPRESAKLVAEYAERWSEDGKYPVFVGGDLNHQPGSETYTNIAAKMRDTRAVLEDEDKVSGYDKTYTGHNDDESDDELLDYIFVLDGDSVDLVDYTSLNNKDGDMFISDHLPVVVNLKIPY